MRPFGEIFEPIDQLPQPKDRGRCWPEKDYILRCAKAASELPPLDDIKDGDLVYRGTLVHRLIFGLRNGVLQIIGNEPTEDRFSLNATCSKRDAAFYARSYGDELAPVVRRIDPVVMVFDAAELREHMPDPGKRWFIPKAVLPKVNVSLAFPGRDERVGFCKWEWDFE